MALKVFNRLTREKEAFVPLVEGEVRMYVCGPTVYDHAHIGHAKTYVAFDVMVRYLRYLGFKVRYVQNITDVGHLLDTGEDRILKKSGTLGLEPMEVVEAYTRSYFDDMDALGVLRPDISPRASGHVPEQIAITRQLIEQGHAYVTEAGDVYFDVTSFPGYGKLSGRSIDDLQGERDIKASDKRHPGDFALWRHAEPEHIMQWESPWGRGFPGWHVECSAMSMKYLGETFDIHGGGLENQFPHNECEIAQSEALTGKPFANYWLLTGSLTLDSVKMSKSLGNVVTVKDALAAYRPEAIRTFILGAHYTSQIDYSKVALDGATERWKGLMVAVNLARYMLKSAPEGEPDPEFGQVLDKARARFIAEMDDDFNTPRALAVLDELTTEVNTLLNSGAPITLGTLQAVDGLYRELGGAVLGIVPAGMAGAGGDAERQAGMIELLVELRTEARRARDFARADLIRDRLAALGVILEDRADGTVYRVE